MTDERHWKVLVIDDSEVALHFEVGVLETTGFDVRGTSQLDEFDALVTGWSPDVILTDVNMPGLSGVELCRALKDRYETAHVPIVLFSSLSDSELAELAAACEADGYLSKVNGLERLPAELRLLCETSQW